MMVKGMTRKKRSLIRGCGGQIRIISLLVETMNVDSCFNDRCWICGEMNFNMLQDMKTVGKQKCVDVGP